MYAIIPAAGYATRLGELTRDKPKHLLEVGRKRIIDYVMERIYELPDIRQIILVTNARFYEQFMVWADEHNYERLTILSDETQNNDDRLGTVGDILFAIGRFGIDGEFMVVGGDNLFEDSLVDAYNLYREISSPVVCTYDLKDLESAKNFGVVSVDEDNRITEFAEKPEVPSSTLIATLIYFFPRRVIDLLKRYKLEGHSMDRSGDFIHWLIEQTNVYSYPLERKWWDIGSLESLSEVRRCYGKSIVE